MTTSPTAEQVELLPCPFCGNDIIRIRSNGIGDFYAICDAEDDGMLDCGARTSGHHCETRGSAIGRWNTRVQRGAGGSQGSGGVTQADRDAAADLRGAMWAEGFRRGDYDDGKTVQAFARHRTASEQVEHGTLETDDEREARYAAAREAARRDVAEIFAKHSPAFIEAAREALSPATEDEVERMAGAIHESWLKSVPCGMDLCPSRPCTCATLTAHAALSPKAEVEPPPPVDVRERARELLADEFRLSERHFTADEIASDEIGRCDNLSVALRAIERALSEGSDLRVRAEEVEPGGRVFDALGNIVSMCADQRDIFPDDATALACVTEAINELYACMEDGVFSRALSPTPDTRGVKP